MTINLNGNTVSVRNELSLLELLVSKNLTTKKGVAVAVNNAVVKREEWKDRLLSNGDHILVIGATKGG